MDRGCGWSIKDGPKMWLGVGMDHGCEWNKGGP